MAYLEGLRDGREVYYRGERVDDVTTHPVLGVAARHSALDLHGPSPKPSPFYDLPRSTADLRRRSALTEESTARGATPVVLLEEIGTDAPSRCIPSRACR